MEVCEAGAALRGCTVHGARIAVAVRGPLRLEETKISETRLKPPDPNYDRGSCVSLGGGKHVSLLHSAGLVCSFGARKTA